MSSGTREDVDPLPGRVHPVPQIPVWTPVPGAKSGKSASAVISFPAPPGLVQYQTTRSLPHKARGWRVARQDNPLYVYIRYIYFYIVSCVFVFLHV